MAFTNISFLDKLFKTFGMDIRLHENGLVLFVSCCIVSEYDFSGQRLAQK